MSTRHEDQTYNHKIERWTYANSTARTAATGFLTTDVGKIAYQESDGTYWRLTDDSPATWAQLAAPGAGPSGITIQDSNGGAAGTYTTLQVSASDFTLTSLGGGSASLVGGRTVDTAVPPTVTVAEAPTLFIAAQRGGGTVASLYRLGSGTIATGPLDATSFDAAEAGGLVNLYYLPQNDVVEFNGKTYFAHTVSTTSHGVWERQANGTWTRVLTQTITTSSLSKTGLYVASRGITSRLFMVTANSTGGAFINYTEDGTNWTTTAATAMGANMTLFLRSAQALIRGVLYTAITDLTNWKLIVADPFSGSIAAVAFSSILLHGITGCGLYGRYFFYTPYTPYTIYEYVGGVATPVASVPQALSVGGTLTSSQPLIFAHGTDKIFLIYCAYNGTAYYWKALYLTFASSTDTAPTVTQCDGIIPAAYTSANAAAGHNTVGFWAYTDTQTDFGDPQTYTWYSASISSTMQYAKFKGASTQMVGTTTGLTTSSFGWPFCKDGGGDRISVDDTNDVIFNAAYPSIGPGTSVGQALVRWKFQARNVAHTFTARIGISVTEGTTYSLATLTGTATGGTRSGNTVTGCPHNTECTVNVDLAAMGIANNTAVRLQITLTKE